MQESPKRRVKIVCTLGPASQSAEQIGNLIEAGMNVARLNFSHGTHAFQTKLFETVREEANKRRRVVTILQDLQGPKLRAGKLPEGGIPLVAGDVLLLFPEGSEPIQSTQGKKTIPISAEIAASIAQDVQPGARILFDDGKIFTKVKRVRSPEIVVEVEVGGVLTSHKGMNLPGTPLSLATITEKDLKDLKLGLQLGVDAVALSFVRTAQDIEEVRARIRKQSNVDPWLIAKIEREEGVQNCDSILEVTDGMLVARGDMAVELGAERVPTIQKMLIHSCHVLGVPIITATQMLESMIHAPTPTRAEASDVANAVFDGTDAVMLSAETASGEYPIQAVETMAKIVIEAEASLGRFGNFPINQPMLGSVVDSVEYSAAKIADHVDAAAIACITHSGMAAKSLAKYRPSKPIVAIMDHEPTLRKINLVWGVQGIVVTEIAPTDDLFSQIEDLLVEEGLAQRNDMIVVTAGIPSLKRGTTNMIKVHRVGDRTERARAKGHRLVKKPGSNS